MSYKHQFLITALLVLATLLVMSFIYKIPFSTDDFSWISARNEGRVQFLDDYFFRLPVWKALHHILFPLYLSQSWLVKFLFWTLGWYGILFPLVWFLKKFGLNWGLAPFLAGLVFFAPNQYEITFLVYSLPYCIGFFLCGSGFWVMRMKRRWIGTILYLLSFLTLESFIVVTILLEVSVAEDRLPLKKTIKIKLVALASLFLLYGGIRLGLQWLNPYHYDILVHLQFSQIRGFFYSCFLIGFYKLNGFLSLLQLLLYVAVIYLLFKISKTKHLTGIAMRALIILTVLCGASSYYFILKYSARRALAGQISFVYGVYIIACLAFLSKLKIRSFVKIALFLLFISPQMINQTHIFRTKQYNYHLMNSIISETQRLLADRNQTVIIHPDQIKKKFKRDWVFANVQDIELLYKTRLSPQEYRRLIFMQ